MKTYDDLSSNEKPKAKKKTKPVPNFERVIRSKKFDRVMTFTNASTEFIFVDGNGQAGENGFKLHDKGLTGKPITMRWTKSTFNKAVLSWYSMMWHAETKG